MRLAYLIFISAAGMFCVSCGSRPDPRVPAGYPASYAEQIHAAEREGELDVLSATGPRKVSGIIAEFHRRYPGIKLHYVEMSAQQVYDTVRKQAENGGRTADLVWSAGMDLQMKLVNDGFTQRYVSPERRPHYPRWSNWKNQAWAVTAEPVVFLYNRRLIADNEVPRDHSQLRAFLESHPAPSRQRLASYSVANSAVGYLYFSQDKQLSRGFWPLVRSFGGNGAIFYPNSEEVVSAVASGRASLAYDIIGSYALDVTKRNPALGIVLPSDYALVVSRIVVIPAAARHPNAAKLFLDLMLSRSGQSELSAQGMPPIRNDVPDPPGLDLRNAPLRTIRVGPGLLVTQDHLTREHFLRRWDTSIRAGATARQQGLPANSAKLSA